MELLELYVEYGTDLKPIDSNIGNFNRFNHNIDRINIEIAESLDDYTLTMNAKRPDGLVNTIGYSLARVDSTNYQLICDDWLTEYEGLVEFSLVANKDGQVITFGKFYVDCIDTIRATSVASPDDPTFQEKVDKDLSTYDQVSEIVDNANTYLDNDGSPEKIPVENNGVNTDLSLMTKGYTMSELNKKVDKSVVDVKYFANVGGVKILSTSVPTVGAIGMPSDGIQAQNTASSIGWKTLGIFERTTTADITVNSTTIFNENLSFRVSRNTQASQIRISIYNDGAWGSVTVDTSSHNSGTFSTGIISVICNSISVGTEIVLPSGDKYYVKIEYYQTQNAPLTVDLVCIQGGLVSTSQFMITGTSITTDLIQDNAVTNGKLAQMPTMTLKGNSTGATADPDDLTVSEVMSMLTPSGQMEIPGSLLVNGDINQIGASYESHQQQVFTEKDFIITRDLATTGLGAGQYSGIIAKLADGTNNSALVFDGNGMARVGDIGTNLASPDFSQTQALATREDTPASRSIPYWDETSKCFKTLIANGGRPSFFISDTDESITMTNGNSTNSSVPTLTVKSRSSIQAPMQGWYQDYQINSFKKATVEYSGKFTSDVGFSGLTSSNNGLVDTNNNIIISRNLGDSVAALTVGQKHASSTGNIANFQFGGVNKLEVTKDGWLFQNGVRLLHTFSHPTGSTAIPVGRNLFIGQEAGNLTMGSTATSTDHASYNSAFGYRTLFSNTTGTSNTANGMQALYSNTTGSYNTANGYAAGRYFGSGTSELTLINNSIFIGYNSRANADNETNEIVIGYNAIGNGSNTVTIGNSSITDYYFNANTNATSRFGNIRFGSITNGAIGDIPATINAITGQTAKLLSLQVNGVEKAYFDKGGIFYGSASELIVKNEHTADISLTVNAIASTTGKLQSWQVDSVEKAYITSGGIASFENIRTGTNTILKGSGIDALTTGENNIFVGTLSGYNTSDGNDNIAVGYGALLQNTSGDYLVGLGRYALRYLYDNQRTIGVGHFGGAYYGSGTDNLTSANNSIYIGAFSRAKENNATNEIVIGDEALGNGSNTATIGNSSLTKLYAGSYQVDTVIKASAVSVSSWSADATYSGYGYRATVTMTGATSSDSAEVVYAHAEAISGNYSPICETLTNGVYIYSKVNTTITLAQVIVHKA